MMDDYDDAPEIAYTLEDMKRIGAKWLDRIKASEKREKKWRDNAEQAETAYLCDDDGIGEVPQFNILHSNVETIVPSIYNSTPVPDIRPRYNAKDPVAKSVADILERVISTQIDDNRLDAEIEASAQDAFMAGRGVVRVQFDADVMDGAVTGERLRYEVVSWRDYREGPGTRWDNVPWVAYRHCVSEEEMERLTDESLPRDKVEREDVDDGEEPDSDIWEIWCKETSKVYFIVESNGTVLSINDDPLELPGFFPQGAPVQPITGTAKRCPVCPYTVYKDLAEELDKITRRINALIEGLKVRGFVIGGAEDIESLALAGDNQLVPVANMEGILAQGGFDRAVLWWPLDKAITVIRELYAQREQTKQAIYEITGISDIIRGQGAASETATAQQIKTEWGALRIKKMQRLIERQVRDLFVISSEIISRHFSVESLQKISGIDIPPEVQELLQSPLDNYRIDVESDSTVRADLTRGRSEMSEFLQGSAQYFSTMAPIAQQAPTAAGPIIEIYASFARQFNLGKSAEDALEQMVEMAQQSVGGQGEEQPNPEADAMKAEVEIKGQEMQMKMQEAQASAQMKAQEMQLKAQEVQARVQLDQAKLQVEQQKLGISAQSAQQAAQLEVQKLQLQAQNLQLEAQLKQADLEIKQRQLGIKESELSLAERKAEVDTLMNIEEMDMERKQERPVKIGDD